MNAINLNEDVKANLERRLMRLAADAAAARNRMAFEVGLAADAVTARWRKGEALPPLSEWRQHLPIDYAFTLAPDYACQPVGIRQFIEDDYYLGKIARGRIYERIVDDLEELFEGDYTEVVLGGGIGWGKSTAAEVGIAYDLYQVSCLRDPAKTYGMRTGSNIAFVNVSVNLKQATKVLFGGLGSLLRPSPYFRQVFPYNPKLKSELAFPRHVFCHPVAANEQSMLGEGVFSAAIDEANFMAVVERSKRSMRGDKELYDQAEVIYNRLSRRILSRMNQRGKLPGKIWLISSARYPDDFTERKEKEAQTAEGKHIFVRHYPAWGTKPKSVYLGNTFRVEVGDLSRQSRVLDGTETDVIEAQVIEVPNDFKEAFKKDTEGCVRDFGGISTLSIKPFLRERQYIQKMFEQDKAAHLRHPFTHLDVTLEDAEVDHLLPELLHWVQVPVLNSLGRPTIKNGKEVYERKLFPALHYAHVDLAKNQCAAGLGVGHVVGTKNVSVMQADFTTTREKKPLIRMDLVLRIVAPPHKEIDLTRIRAVLYQLAALGMEFGLITYDHYQSQESVKTLKEQGYNADNFSLDNDYEGYAALKAALYDQRVACYYIPVLERELAQLEDTGKKIDHPSAPGSSKDLADCVAAVVHQCEEGWRKGDAIGTQFMPGIVEYPGQVSPETHQQLEQAVSGVVEGRKLTPDEERAILFGDLDKLDV